MTKIALLGAGSTKFTRKVVADILQYPELQDAVISLHDIDPERLRTAEAVTARVSEAVGARATVEASLDRRQSIAGADFVINTIQVGGATATRFDFDIPREFGIRYTINDTINVGGVMRGLRTSPVIQAILRDMEELAPDAWFLNYTNPMAMVVWLTAAESRVRTVGLCHSVDHTVHLLASYLEIPAEEVQFESAGINHLAFIVRMTHDGEDLDPRLRRFVADGRVPKTDLVRAELYRRLGFYPTESSEHHADYSPWFITKGLVEPLAIPLDELLRRDAASLAEFEDTRRMVETDQPLEVGRSEEQAATVIQSLVTGTRTRIIGNVMNGPGLVENLPRQASVEVPCFVDGLGIHPVPMGALPPQCAAYVTPAIHAQEMVVKAVIAQDRSLIYHAIAQDPQAQALLSLGQVWEMTDRLIEAEARWLPGWLGGTAGSG
jgi:alpha-galactosidase